MNLNLIITGATGMVGKGVLMFCLDDERISGVLSISRSPLGLEHPKLKELIVGDFSELQNYREQLSGYDACYFSLGTSSVSMKEEEFRKVTHDLTIDFAHLLIKESPKAVFCYVTGEGTDSTGRSKTMWARVKGQTENELLAMGFGDAYMFRPGFIKALRGSKTKTKVYAIFYTILRPFFPLIMLSKKFATDTDKIAEAMIRVSLNRYDNKVLNTRDINDIAT